MTIYKCMITKEKITTKEDLLNHSLYCGYCAFVVGIALIMIENKIEM